MMKFATRSLTAIALTAALAVPAHAVTSGWMPPSQVKAYMKSLDRSGQLPTRLECRDNPDRLTPDMRVTSARNSADKVWVWSWGRAVRRNEGLLERDGYREVSNSTSSGLFGRTVRCVVWHRAKR